MMNQWTWATMDSAPKDGTWILVRCCKKRALKGSPVEVVRWCGEKWQKYWYSPGGGVILPNERQFNAWQPLPSLDD